MLYLCAASYKNLFVYQQQNPRSNIVRFERSFLLGDAIMPKTSCAFF